MSFSVLVSVSVPIFFFLTYYLLLFISAVTGRGGTYGGRRTPIVRPSPSSNGPRGPPRNGPPAQAPLKSFPTVSE